jgi:hypothetical protein
MYYKHYINFFTIIKNILTLMSDENSEKKIDNFAK